MTLKLRVGLFMLLVAVCLAVSIAYVWKRSEQINGSTGSLAGNLPVQENPPTSLPDSGFVLFRSTQLGSHYGQLATAPLDNPSSARTPIGVNCERAYFANGYGVCLTAERGVMTTYKAFIFDRTLRSRQDLPPLKGIPSRTRISPDGRYVAITVFVSGHSYSPGTFSTRVEIYRTDDGSLVGELEQFSVERDGKEFKNIDFNFWGVTFSRDSNRFYATLGTGGNNYLVEGDLATRHARVVHGGVECPSLSPDGRRIAFKRLTKSGWHIYVVDLSTGTETPLAEMRSVDDQVEWLDDDRLLYALENDIWMVPANGGGVPTRYLSEAFSPAVVR